VGDQSHQWRANKVLITDMQEDFAMPLTLSEANRELEENRHQLAVWNEVKGFLSKLISTVEKEAQQAITAEGCVNKTVPQEVLIAVVQYIEKEHVDSLVESIKALENFQVMETNDEEEDEKAKSAKSRRPVIQKPGVQKGPAPRSGNPSSAVRSVG